MVSVTDLTNSNLSLYVPVPPVDNTVCDICHRVLGPAEVARCETCNRTTQGVASPVTTVVPISFSRDQYHYVLRDYKSAVHRRRTHFKLVAAATLARFYNGHQEHLRDAMGNWDTICVVPSTRPGATDREHPFFNVVSLAPRVPNPTPLLVTTGTPPAHRLPREDGYRVNGEASGMSVLLLDDTYTTGAHLQSAASALSRAGARVVGALVLGRYIDPDYAPYISEWWRTQRRKTFTFDTCCLE